MTETAEKSERCTGGCQCGAVRYAFDGPPLEVYVCHCTECRKQSASAFGISVIVPGSAVRLTSGSLVKWTRPTDSGTSLDCFFCPDCGSRLWHGNPVTEAQISIKGGSLDEPPDISSADHIWTSSKLAGVVIPPTARQFPGEPD
ncbi:MAG: GFA family protein [Rhizobiales bacterium]|nr:GFA family protein [Hyphomicrobiales bacterium]